MHIQRISASGTCRKIITAAVFAAAVFLSAGSLHARTLNIGILKNDYFKSPEELRPFALFIQQQNKYTDYTIIESDSPQSIAEAMSKGRVQMAFISVYPAVMLHKRYGSAPDLSVTANGTLYIKSCIFVLKDSPVKWVADIRNKTVAFSSPFSTGGYYLPESHIAKIIGNGQFKRLFAENWDDVFTQVFLKKSDAGATQYVDYEELLPPLYKSVFRTIAETESIPGLFLYIADKKEKNKLMNAALSFSADKKPNRSVINGLSPIDFDWKTLSKSILVR